MSAAKRRKPLWVVSADFGDGEGLVPCALFTSDRRAWASAHEITAATGRAATCYAVLLDETRGIEIAKRAGTP